MPDAIDKHISLFRSQIEEGRFTDATLRILEFVFVAKDLRSLLEIRSCLRQLLRSEATAAMERIAEKAADEKLSIAEFFVKAFALIGDVESCLALKYEALVLRETKYYNNIGFRVSYQEWYTFAKDSLDNRYYSIAVKGFESAIMCFKSDQNVDGELGDSYAKDCIVDKIRKLRDEAAALISSCSVQALSSKYLKRKVTEDDQRCSLSSTNSKQVASVMFRVGIRKRNIRKLHQSQRKQWRITGP